MNLGRICGLLLGIVAAVPVASFAQENLERGKTPAQLYASDCAICHKSPYGLSKAGGLFGLSGFLRTHYTTSRETASAIAAYLDALDRQAPPPAPRRATGKRPPKADSKKPEAAETKPGDKPAEAKPAEAKATEAKPAESKPAEAKPAEAKPAEAKPAEAKPAESKPAEPKPN
ncbi:MAG: hypothetical protein ACK4UO_11785 [Pseudolabrys sp.]